MNTREFAKLCGVKKRTLFYYDELGLLKPLRVHENNYREYAPEQLCEMDAIKLLQASGYTLKEISGILQEDADARRDYFFASEARIDQKIAELQEMKAYIARKKALLQEYRDFLASGKACDIHQQTLVYTERPIPGDSHFFSFLSDGSYDSAILDDRQTMYAYKESPQGLRKEGLAATFFLEIPVEAQMLDAIVSYLPRLPFRSEGRYFVSILPLLLRNTDGRVILKVTTFEAP